MRFDLFNSGSYNMAQVFDAFIYYALTIRIGRFRAYLEERSRVVLRQSKGFLIRWWAAFRYSRIIFRFLTSAALLALRMHLSLIPLKRSNERNIFDFNAYVNSLGVAGRQDHTTLRGNSAKNLLYSYVCG